ncbi:DDT domain-containing protein PTM [Musa acuminata AAA Group]|uniref:DDT domain-containing protein PTM n=1 Tax=Musa acuminata AAA Group TaxID=214697 RepID=UPI0031E0B7D0
MELVGRTVKKIFPGFGTFSGVVKSYDPSAGYFKVLYEDGDSEEVDYGEIASMLMEMGEEASPMGQNQNNNRSRWSKKRTSSELDLPEDVDIGSGKVVGVSLIGEDGELSEQNGLFQGSGGKGEVSELNGGGYEGILKENGIVRVPAEITGNDGYPKEEISGNASSEGLVETPQAEKLEAESDLGDADESSIGVGKLSEHNTGNAYQKGSEQIKVKEAKSEDCVLDGVYLENQRCDTTCFVEKDEGGPQKRRRLSGKIYSLQDMPLRRSARRASAAALCPSDPLHSHILKSESEFQNCLLDEKDHHVVPEDSKPELPPSSSDLDLNDLPVLDFFSVYTLLRSFSRVLFLSPFSRPMFLSALRCEYPNSLIDHIHFSILQTLKQHLELLSEEGYQPATDSLRTLNWELLDLVTWPVYLGGYSLIHGSTMKSLVKLTHPNIMAAEYYMQPASVKLEMLRCLCDDVMEVDGMRSELNIRLTDCEINVDAYNNVYKNRIGLAITGLEASLVQEMPEETADGNSDDCCLCGMDGSLICCDGCPAAFHSRCVGVAKDLLPEGDWYCPECLMDKHDGLTKLSKTSRGAEVLGIDPHGRLYFSSCGYLLVSDSCESVSSSHFYNKDDLEILIRVLKSSHASYTAIVNTISAQWGISLDSRSSISQSCHEIIKRNEALDSQLNLLSSDPNVVNDDIVKNSKDNCTNSEHSDPISANASDLSQTNLVSLDHASGMSLLFVSSEPAEQLAHAVNYLQSTQQTTDSCSIATDNPVDEVISVTPVDISTDNSKHFAITDLGGTSFISEQVQKKAETCKLQSDPCGYINYYIFGRVASSVAEDLMIKSSESNNKEPKKSDEDMVVAQLKAIFKRCPKLSSYSFLQQSLDIQKEKCGWCHSCKTSSSSDCAFVVNDKHIEDMKSDAVGLDSEKKKKSHIVSVMHDILSIEDHLNGLLSGPWENPHYSSLWRKAVMKASDVASLKHMLLLLESNLRRVAMLSDWMKPVDFAHTVGSASHILIGSMDAFSNCGGSRKQGKRTTSGSEFNISQAAAASYVCWWRGGRLSRRVFHWKMLPRSLTSKGGRQAGCKKISNVFYPDVPEFARRNKFITWRAAVEMSETVAQLAFLTKEFDSNIRWLELCKTPPFPQLIKESKGLARFFKKVIIRRKSIEGAIVRYLLDFGKRENIPSTVIRYGVIHEDPSSERKKFWLGENYVPLYLIKAFEAKKLARSIKKTGSKLLSHDVVDFGSKKPERSKGLSYLISKAEKMEAKLCGQCNKNVLIREAVNCQLCNGSFHQKHFRVTAGAISTKYICYRCKTKKSVNVKTQRQKMMLQKKKKSSGKKSVAMPKKRKRVLVKNKKKPNPKKKHKQVEIRKAQSRKCEEGIGYHKRKRRTTMHHSFWLNGLLWMGKADDERGKHFRKTNVVLPFQMLRRSSRKPVCCLCLTEYNSEVMYVCCQNCEDWFHGDVYSLALEEINNLIGFKCHKCRGRSAPVCPFSQSLVVHEIQSMEFPIAETIITEEQDTKEKLHSGTSESSSVVVHDEDYLDQQKDCSPCVRDESTFALKTELLNGPYCVQSFDPEDQKFISCRHDNGLHIEATSQKVGESSNEMVIVQELLVSSNVDHSEESRILSGNELCDVEIAKY